MSVTESFGIYFRNRWRRLRHYRS